MSSNFNKSFYIVVTPFFPSPTNWRGAYCYDFVKALKKARPELRVEVLVPGRGEDYEIEGINVRRFRTWQLPSNILPFLFRRRNERSFLAAVKRAGIDLKDVGVCHGHTANFAIYPLAIKRENAKCLTLLHHHDPQSFGLGLGILRHCWLYNMLEFSILRHLHEQIDVHVFISEMVKKSFLSAPDASWTKYQNYRRQMRGLGCYRPTKIKRGIVLHNGVDTKVFYPAKKMQSNGKFTVGCVGNFIDWKDQLTLLKAVRKLGVLSEGVRVVFVGSGPERAKCEEYARAHGIDAEFRDEVRHEELPAFYHSIDLFVLPSYFEGFGCVFTEAWACGVPFITCQGQGMDDMIHEEDCDLWLCKLCDPEDLATKIKQIAENRSVQRLKGEIDIHQLVPDFIDAIDGIRKNLVLA